MQDSWMIHARFLDNSCKILQKSRKNPVKILHGSCMIIRHSCQQSCYNLAKILARFLQESCKVLPRFFNRVVLIQMSKSSECGMRLGGGKVSQLKELFRPFLNFMCNKFLYELFETERGLKVGRRRDVILTPVFLNSSLALDRNCSFAMSHVLQSFAW